MKLAVLSDIHGNILALEAVLEDIKNQGIEKLYILGDLAFSGPKPKETLDFIKQNLTHHVIIQGNTDDMIVNATDAEDDPLMPKKKVMANAIRYAQRVLSDDDKKFLDNLPKQHYEEIEGLKLLFVHGSPRSNSEGITPEMPYNEIQETLKDTESHVVFCGHTHYPVIHVVDGKKVVNAGSVGRPFGENLRSVYAILDLTEVKNRKFDIEHRYVKYDVEQAAKDLEECDFEGSDVLASMLRRATDKFPKESTV